MVFGSIGLFLETCESGVVTLIRRNVNSVLEIRVRKNSIDKDYL